MPINFPNSPAIGDVFVVGSSSYKWSGSAWLASTLPYWPTPVAVSSNITLAANGRYFVDTTTSRTLTLPASPALGDEIMVFDATGTAGANVITIANNSNKINGTLDSALLDVNGVAAVFIWTGSTYGWRMG